MRSKKKRKKKKREKVQALLFLDQAAASDGSPKVVFCFSVGLKFIPLKTSVLILILFRVPDLPPFLSQPSWYAFIWPG